MRCIAPRLPVATRLKPGNIGRHRLKIRRTEDGANEMSGWGCPHELNGVCQHIKGRTCDPGMKGCVLAGRFRFSDETKNRPPRPLRDSRGGRAHPGGRRGDPV